MEDYTLYDFKDIRKLVGRQLKEERHKLEPNRYKVKKPKPKKILSQEECVHILKSTDFLLFVLVIAYKTKKYRQKNKENKKM